MVDMYWFQQLECVVVGGCVLALGLLIVYIAGRFVFWLLDDSKERRLTNLLLGGGIALVMAFILLLLAWATGTVLSQWIS